MPFTIPNEADVAITDLAEPDRVDIDILVEGIKRNGVVSGGAVSAQVTPDDTVAITAVTFEYNGRRYSIAGGNSPSMPANGASPMFYLVCATTGGTFSVVPGTAASQPSFPSLPGNAVVLAAVYRDAGVTTVQNNRIVDKRVLVVPVPMFDQIGVGLGTAAINTKRQIDIDSTRTVTDAGVVQPIRIAGTHTWSTTTGGELDLLASDTIVVASVASATLRGLLAKITLNGSGNITTVTGIETQIVPAGGTTTMTITNWRGVYSRHTRFLDTSVTTTATAFEGEIGGGGGTVGTAIGLKLTSLAGTTTWGLQVGDYQSYHQGPMAIGTNAAPNAAAILDLVSTTKAFLPPRLSSTQRDALSAFAQGMVIFNTTAGCIETFDGKVWGALMPVIEFDIRRAGAKCDLKRGVGAAGPTNTMTTGSNVVTLASGDGFVNTATNSGQTIVIPGAGVGGIDLVTTISTVTDPTHAVVAANASTTVVSKIVFWGTNDTSAVNLALANLPAIGGRLVVPRPTLCAGQLTFGSKRNITIAGVGGIAADTPTSANGMNQSLPPSCLLYTGTGATDFLVATSTTNFLINDCAILYTNAGFSGSLIDFTGSSDSSARTARPTIRHSQIGAAIDGLVNGTLVEHTFSWKATYDSTVFVGGDIQVLAVNGANNFVNGPTYRDCTFALYGTVAIRNPGEDINVQGGMVERAYNATTANRNMKFIDCGDGTMAVDGGNVNGTWFSDVNNAAPAATCIALAQGTTGIGGFAVGGCRMGGGTNQTYIKLLSAFKGISIRGGSAPFNGTLLDANNQAGSTGVVEGNSIGQGSGLTLVANTTGATITTT
jgi:hypothetical protein